VAEESLLKDEKTQDAVKKCVEAIGAAASEASLDRYEIGTGESGCRRPRKRRTRLGGRAVIRADLKAEVEAS